LALTEWVPLKPEESAKLNKTLCPDEVNKLSIKVLSQAPPKVIPVI